jgi:hypothetical protein
MAQPSNAVSPWSSGIVDRMCSKKRFVICAVALLLTTHAGMLAYSATKHSPTKLEPTFLVAGLSHYRFGHFKLFCVNPPLVRMVAALPVMAAGYEMDWSGFHDVPGARPEFAMGEDFIKSNGERSIWLFTIARWACIPFSLLGALFCFFWSRELWGRNDAGLISLILWCFEPNILAHGELITTDCAAASFGVGAAYFFWRWLKCQTWVRAGLAGLLFALAQLSKLSWLFLYGLWPVLWLFWIWNEGRGGRDRNRKPRSPFFASALQLAYILGLGLYLTNLAYGFGGTGARLGEFQFVSHMLGGNKPGEAGNRFATSALGNIAVPLPSHYLLGFDLQKKDHENYGQPSYLQGEWKEGGWWYYYLYGLAVKTPHGTQVMLLLATFTTIYAGMRRFGNASSINIRNLSVVVMPALLLLVLVSSQTEFNLHVRYVLPVLGFAFVIIGAAAFWFSAKPSALQLRRARFPMAAGCQALILVSLLATTTSTLGVYPHQLAYFNELAGGPLNGPRHLLGSNVDWGQGLLALDQLLDVRSDWGPVALLGSESPDALGIRVVPESARVPIASVAGYSHIAVSANDLARQGQAFRPDGNSPHDAELLAALRHQRPVDVTDYSILVFETRPLLTQPRRGDLSDGPPGPAKANGAALTIPTSLPSLADARDTKPTISTLNHILLLHGPLDTCLKTPVSGLEALRILTDERRATAAFGESPFVRTRNGLRYKIDGVLVSEGEGIGESHRDQCLSTFAYLGLPPTYPITLQSEARSIQDLVSESIANFSLDQREITWTAIAYAHYLPPARHWTDRFGRTTTFSGLLQHLVDLGYSGQSCGGLHVLEAIAKIVEADYRSGILDRRTRLAGRRFLRDSLEQAVLSQSEDGSWDLGWFRPNSDETSRTSDPSSLDPRIVVTGHMLQLMHEIRNPPRRAILRATRWLIEVLEKLPNGSKQNQVRVCPLTHALLGIQRSWSNRDGSRELEYLFATH